MQGWNEMSNAGDFILGGQHSWMLTKVKRVLVWKLYALWDKLGRFKLNFLWEITWFMGIFINLDLDLTYLLAGMKYFTLK